MSTVSHEHLQYLKTKKREKIFTQVIRFMLIFFFLVIWEILAYQNIINTFLYSSPSHILSSIFHLFYNGELWHHISITTFEVLCSFCLSTLIGFFIAFLLWRFSLLYPIFDPFLTILNSLPKVALGPLIIIWFGSGIPSIIFMALMISVFTTILNIYIGFISIPDYYFLLFHSFHANSFQIFHKLVLPYNLSSLKSTLKINISLCLTGVVMGELLVSKNGLGYLIMYGSQVFQLDLVLMSVFLLAILSYLFSTMIDITFYYLQKKRN